MRNKDLKRQIDNAIIMRDGNFGICLNFEELMPMEEGFIDRIIITIKNKKGVVINTEVFLPHQVYLQDLIEMSNKGEYDVFVQPCYPEIKPFNIFKDE